MRVYPSLSAGGNLDVPVSTRAAQSNVGVTGDAPATTGTLHAKINELLARVASPGSFAVQYGTISVADSVASNTATISSVDLTKSIVVLLGTSSDGGTANAEFYEAAMPRVSLTNATTVTLNRTSASGALVMSFAVLTFPFAVTVQSGTIALNGVASNTATIAAVTAAKTIVFNLGMSVNPGVSPARSLTRFTLTNSTTITATRGDATGNTTWGYSLVQLP